MKKIISTLFILSLLNFSVAIAQNKTASKLGSSSAPKGHNKNDSLMCGKEWHLTSLEEWSVVSKPGDKNKDDMLHMTLDGKYDLIMFGNKKSGTWIRSGVTIYFTDDATKTKFTYKVLSVEEKKLRVDHYSDEEGHSIFEYEPK